MDHDKILVVAEVIFDKKFVDLNKVKEFIMKTWMATPADRALIPVGMILPATATYNNIIRRTAELTIEEPPGYIPLGFLVIFFAQVLTTVMQKEYFCHHQFVVARNSKRDANPSTDTALVALENDRRKPDVLYEYKPRVHPDMAMVSQDALIEGLLQSRYCVQYNESYTA